MILSHAQIEEIAAATTKDFNRFFFKEDEQTARSTPRGTPIDQLASQYLGLKVSFTRLSRDGSLCGVTAYSDTEYIFETDGMTRTIPLKRNQVLLDSSFIDPGQIKKLCGKRRFTLAHECAHQILFQMESDASKTACRRQYSERRAYSLRDLKTREDWNEWQANALGAAILMPQEEIKYAILRYCPNRKLICYENHFIYIDRLAIKLICDVFKVSKTVLTIRLRQRGYLEDRPFSEYRDPVEVWP